MAARVPRSSAVYSEQIMTAVVSVYCLFLTASINNALCLFCIYKIVPVRSWGSNCSPCSAAPELCTARRTPPPRLGLSWQKLTNTEGRTSPSKIEESSQVSVINSIRNDDHKTKMVPVVVGHSLRWVLAEAEKSDPQKEVKSWRLSMWLYSSRTFCGIERRNDCSRNHVFERVWHSWSEFERPHSCSV